MNTIENTIQQLSEERANQICSRLREHHRQFQLLSHKWSDYFNTLKSTLPEDCIEILYQYEETANSLYSISQDQIYMQGLKDGARLMKFLYTEPTNDTMHDP